MIRGCSPLHNGILPLGTSFTKFATSFIKFDISFTKCDASLKKNWYIQSLSYRNLYLITHGPFIPLGIFEKWLEVVPYSEMNFGTLGTSLRKFDKSNPWANETPISLPMVFLHLETLGKWLEVVPFLGMDFGNLDTSFIKFGTSLKKMVHPILELSRPLSY